MQCGEPWGKASRNTIIIICIGMCKNVMYPNTTCLCLFPPQKNKCRKDGTLKQIRMNTAEIKILISICYYFVLAVYNLTSATVALWRSKLFENEVIEHFACCQDLFKGRVWRFHLRCNQQHILLCGLQLLSIHLFHLLDQCGSFEEVLE